MISPAPQHCPSCGSPFPPGEEACPVHGVPAGALEVSQEEPPTGAENALTGQLVGEYRVQRFIGRGGMGVVYEAEHVTLGRKVAIKLLREEHAHSPYARDLLNEARAASAIRHRGIIDVFGFGEQPGLGQYLVMEYLEGQPLHELIARSAPLAPVRVIQLLGEVLDALMAAHAQGVIHRDLKPSNIFMVRELDGSEYIKVLDFGLAKRTSTPDGLASRSEVIVGTPHYMAPEQALSQAVGPRSDLYAVGVIAFEMLTRRRLFTGRSPFEMVAHHLKSTPPRPSYYVELPPRLEDLILRLLAKKPEQRPASAGEVARELRGIVLEGESAARPVDPPAFSQVKYSPTFAFMDAPTLQRVTPVESAAPSAPSAPALTPQPRGRRWQRGVAAGALLTLVVGGAVIARMLPGPPQQLEAPVSAPVEASLPAASERPPAPVPERPPEPAPEPPRSEAAPQVSPSPSVAKMRPPPKATPVVARKTPQILEATPSPSVTPSPAPPAPADERRAETGILHVISSGSWAEVWVDGERLGRVPPVHRYTLTAGEHQLELRNPRRETHAAKILIPPGEVLEYTRELTPLQQPQASP